MGKRYYWLKLKSDFFDSKRIKKLRRLAGGDTYTIIYLKMQLLAIKTGGELTYTALEPTFAEELALDLDESVDDVRMCLTYLQSTGLIETSDNINFFLPYAVENTGSEGASAQRMRDFRIKASQCDATPSLSDTTVTPMLQNRDGEIEIEKEIDKRDRDRDRVNDDFDLFWKAYPRKVAKEAARKAFKKVTVPVDQIIADLEKRKTSRQWQDMQYIPNPSTYLNGKRWEDEPDVKEEPKWAEPAFDETERLKRRMGAMR